VKKLFGTGYAIAAARLKKKLRILEGKLERLKRELCLECLRKYEEIMREEE